MQTINRPKSLLTMVALAILTSGAAMAQPVENGPGWTGYTARGKIFTRVSAEWRQPAVQCTLGNSRVSIWVGFGGGGTLQQDGVIAVCSGVGAPRFYKAWWEMFRGPPNNTGAEPFVVSAGDEIKASVEYRGDSVTLEVTDKTNGGHFKSVQACNGGCPRSTAEWIVERPGSGAYPLAQFAKATFKHAKARGDGDADRDERSGSGLTYTRNVMVVKGVTLADCDALRAEDDGDGKTFSCTWDAAQ